MNLASCMQHPVVTITAETSVLQARALMQHHRIRHLPVLQDGVPIGMVSEHHLCRVAPSRLAELAPYEVPALLDRLPVQRVMTRRFLQRPPDTLVAEAAWLLWQGQSSSILVVEHQQLVGIVTATDLIACLVALRAPHWTPAYHQIVMATNFSAAADQALHTALTLARQHGAALTLLHVLSPPGRVLAEDVEHVPVGMLEELHHARQNDALQRLYRVAESNDDLPMTCHVIAGEPTTEIVRMALRVHADLIVVGSRNTSPWRRIWASSIATGVERSACCPVLVVQA